jgi:hypothetical protein
MVETELQVDNQVAAPTETRTPNLHRAKRIAPRECEWKHGDSGDSAEKKHLTQTGLLMEGVIAHRPGFLLR